jgi:putative addiction module component (TIGR02574 family)
LAITETLMNELMKLSRAERIQLAVDLWESVEPEDRATPTATHVQRAGRRHANQLGRPEQASMWDEVRAQLLARFGHSDAGGSGRDRA